eukprot:TRINITY_DN1891_c0_g1_i7.p1 TRINITY_DN1891_c0_g1~~TRINITY_DN1891_c0_g1_i7.p1  ORF type:complete len:234 (+),score=66.85 TRINITY_DN1891_c0_g1_i7:199-900(+)
MNERDVHYNDWFEYACWAKDIRGVGLTMFEGWNYAAYPYFDGINPEDSDYRPHPKYNVTSAIKQALTLISNEEGPLYKSMMLRFLLHIVGDMHQPLNVITRVTPKHTSGDNSGRLFKIRGQYSDLYSLWNNAMGKITEIKRPLDKAGRATINYYANSIKEQYPREKLSQELRIKKLYVMTAHIYDKISLYAYDDIQEFTTPTEYYLASKFERCKQLIALAGYRLADFLNENLE